MAKLKYFRKRCRNHDYRKPCMYHIVLTKNPEVGNLCEVYQNPGKAEVSPAVRLLHNGIIAESQLKNWQLKNPGIKILISRIMPDHIHILLHVKVELEKELGAYISYFTGSCSRMLPQDPISGEITSFFEEGFTDTIISRKGQKDLCYDYIRRNPERLLIRKLYPHYFQTHRKLILNSGEYHLYGNLALLDHPLKRAVYIRTHFSRDVRQMLHHRWEETIRSGGVLVSPFIKRAEKNYKDLAINEGARIILILTNGFRERYKPGGILWDLCCQGRLLIVAPPIYIKRYKIEKADGLRGNKLANGIAALLPGQYQISKI